MIQGNTEIAAPTEQSPRHWIKLDCDDCKWRGLFRKQCYHPLVIGDYSGRKPRIEIERGHQLGICGAPGNLWNTDKDGK
jgi:hypothetical protein